MRRNLTKRTGRAAIVRLLVQLFVATAFARFVRPSDPLTADVKFSTAQRPQNDHRPAAWAEVYAPGAGWIGLDPTSGLLAGEGHIPLACAADPITAAPITGSYSWTKLGDNDLCREEFRHDMRVTRIHEDPRVTKPYSDRQWRQIDDLGHEIDELLKASDVRLTMGGEPTFVSIDDRDGEGPAAAAAAARPLRAAGSTAPASAVSWRIARGVLGLVGGPRPADLAGPIARRRRRQRL
jgi:hypothetical protein